MIAINSLYVATGAFFGAISRFIFTRYMQENFPTKLPLATFLINIVGSFLLGLIIGARVGGRMQLLFGTGFMGAFTTFSTFKLENIQLLAAKEGCTMVIYITLSYMIGIGFAFMGIIVGQRFFQAIR